MAAKCWNDTERKSASKLSITNLTAVLMMMFSGANMRNVSVANKGKVQLKFTM